MHPIIVSSNELDSFAKTVLSKPLLPDLMQQLLNQVPRLTYLRIPVGDAIYQSGFDCLLEVQDPYLEYVPQGKSCWEIGTGKDPQDKATEDLKKRTDALSAEERANSTFVFVTPRSGGEDGWPEPKQRAWLKEHSALGWRSISIIDGVRLENWVRGFPAIGKWLAREMKLTKSIAGFCTATEHWNEHLARLHRDGDPPLLPKIFLAGRDQACTQLTKLFQGEISQLAIMGEGERDTLDFVAAYLASLDKAVAETYRAKCLFFDSQEAWLSFATLKQSHVLVAHPKLDLESSGERLYSIAKGNRHSVIFQTSTWSPGGGENVVRISSPSANMLEPILIESGYTPIRAKEAASAGAESLEALKRHLRGLSGPPQYASGEHARALAIAELLGRWSGQNEADKAAIEEFLRGKTYGEWIETIQLEALRPGAPLSQHNDNWKFVSRAQAWSALGPQLFNDDLDAFQKLALKVLGESDPKLDLPPEERYAASIHGKTHKYSSYLSQGIADTLALLGSKPKSLTQCTVNKPELIAGTVVQELLHDADWVRWASLNQLLPLLAEASPEQFMGAVENALRDTPQSPFLTLFQQERTGLMGGNYMSGLLWALETLAWSPDHLVQATMLLGQLSDIDPGGNWGNRPSNSLGTIFMPWFPQTCAPIPKRISAIKTLLKEHPEIGWKLLLKLLPDSHQSSMGGHKPVWRDFISSNFSEHPTHGEYREQVFAYAELTVETATTDIQRLTDLIEKFPTIPPNAQSKILDHLISQEVLRLPPIQKTQIWETLIDLALKHRKFADAYWSMKSEMVQKIEETASLLAPESPDLLHRRLFSERDFDLMEEKGDYEEQSKNLETRRQKAIKEILDYSQLKGVIEFAKAVASPRHVGFSLGAIAGTAEDTIILPRYLSSHEKSLEEMTAGYIWGRWGKQEWPWARSAASEAWSLEDKATFLSFLPFKKETWEMADALLGQEQEIYWKRIHPNPFSAGEHTVEAIEKFLKYDRPYLAVDGLNALVHLKKDFPVKLAMDALKAQSQSKERAFDQHDIVSVIEWLHDQPGVDLDALAGIEWAFLPLLDRLYGHSPKALESRLAKSPDFFCELIRTIFKSKKEEKKEIPITDAQKAIAENAYRLLQQWQLVPGVNPDKTFDSITFNNWLEVVRKQCIESGHLSVAMSKLGETLVYSPPDPSGLWIHKAVAEALNAKDTDSIRSGFTCELFNKRGVHGFSAGKEEELLASEYRQKAEAVEAHGYHRLAASLKVLATSYDADAEREKTRNPYED